MDHFSHRAAKDDITAAQSNAVGTADIPVNGSIPKWDCTKSLSTNNGRQFSCDLLPTVCRLSGMRKLTSSTYHPMDSGSTERVNHTMA